MLERYCIINFFLWMPKFSYGIKSNRMLERYCIINFFLWMPKFRQGSSVHTVTGVLPNTFKSEEEGQTKHVRMQMLFCTISVLQAEVQEIAEFVHGLISNLWWNHESSPCHYCPNEVTRKLLLIFLVMCYFHTPLWFLRGIKENNVE